MFACCGSMSRRCSSPVTPSFPLPFLHPALEVRPSAMRRRRATQSGLDKKMHLGQRENSNLRLIEPQFP
jgi:hypothetical protein